MTTTIAEPIGGDLPTEQVADLIDAAAQLIHDNGLEVGDLWPDSLTATYEPGTPCCTAGALAVACGYRYARDVEETFTATSEVEDWDGTWNPHPVFAAVMVGLGFETPEELYDWSDTAQDREVVDALRDVAADIRRSGDAA